MYKMFSFKIIKQFPSIKIWNKKSETIKGLQPFLYLYILYNAKEIKKKDTFK